MKRFVSAIHILSWVISLFILISVAAVAVFMLMGSRIYCIKTGSMYPNYPIGSLIFVDPISLDELESGDVITYHTSSAVVTHRAVSVDRDHGLITTKGDNNNTEDFAPVDYENVIGKVYFDLPYLGYPVLLFETKVGKVIIINFVLILILANLLINYLTEDDYEEDGRPTDK